MRGMIVVLILLAGCTTPEPATSPVDDAPVEEFTGDDDGPDVVQEASVAWTAPASLQCAEDRRIDPLADISHGYLEIDDDSWNLHFEAIFETGPANLGFDIGFYNDANEPLGGAVELTLTGATGTLVGVVPADAEFALFTTCGGGTAATYRSGNIL